MTYEPGDGNETIEKLQIGIGADLSQLESDLEDAEKKIIGLSDKIDKDPIKISVTPDVDAKAFIAKIQQAVAGQTVKVSVKAGSVVTGGKGVPTQSKPADAPVVTPRIAISDANQKLDFFEKRIKELKEVAGAKDVSIKVDTDAMGDVTKGVLTYTNALGKAQSETYKLVDILDETGTVASREFQFIGESLSESTTKAKRFQESLKGLENTLNTFATKNADIADQIGLDDLRASFASLKEDTNAEVTAIQRFRNELGAAKVKVDEIRAAQQAQADTQRQSAREQMELSRQQRAEERAAIQEQMAYEQAMNQLKSVSMSGYRQEQLKITEILKKQFDIINRRIAAERKSATGNRQTIAAVQLQKATMETTAYTARMAIYAKDVVKQIEKARNNMAGMQGYARSTMNIFKGIMLSQAFYRGLSAIKNVVSDAWELSIALNSAEAAFSGMLVGGQSRAQGLLEVLKQEAINTPFDLNNLLKATRQLTAYGIQAENLMYVMRAVEKATAASGDVNKMEAISRALGQMYTRGKVVSQEIIQLQEAGIAAGEILTKELGLPPKLSQDWGKLNIDANTAINAIVRGIEERYGKALDNMAKTTEQKISNMKESFALIAGSITDPIRRAIDSLVDLITPRIERLYQAIQAVGLGNALKTLLPPGLFNAAITAINGIVRAAQAIAIVFKQMKPIITAVMNAMAWYGRVIYNIFISILSALGLVGNALNESATGAMRLEVALKYIFAAMLAVKVATLAVAAASKIWVVVSTLMRGVMLVAQGVGVAMRVLTATMSAAGIAGAAGFMPVIGILLVIIGLVAALSGSLRSVIDAATRVGAALKNLGGGTNLGNMFQDMSSSLQEQIDAYNAKVAKQNAELSNALIENEEEQTDHSADAAGATKKAMEGLMSFDEVYKLMEPSSGGRGIEALPLEVDPIPALDLGGVFDDIGGLGEGLIEALDLSELQSALGDLWTTIFPLLDDILIYGLKMLGYFKQMQLYSKLMTDENKEQWTLEKGQTSEDSEQLAKEKQQTTEDSEQTAKEKLQTSEDSEQVAKEKLQTSEDSEQAAKEKLQTAEDSEQLIREKLQTAEDSEQLAKEKLQTAEDREQWTISKSGGAGGGTGGKGTAAALALINIAQIGASAKLLVDDFKAIASGGAELSDWMSLFVNGLMMAVDVLQLIAAFKLIFGGLGAGATAAGAAGKAGGVAAGSSAGKVAVDVGTAAGAAGAGVGLFAAGMLAIPVVVGGALLAYDALTDSVWKYGDAIGEIQKSRASGSKIISDQMSDEREYVSSLVSQYGQLASKEGLTAQERQRLQNITDQLVKTYPDLNKYVGEESGLLKLSAASLDSYIKSANQRASLDYLTQQRHSLIEEERLLLALLSQAETEEAEAYEQAAQSKTQWDWIQYENKKQATDKVRELLEQNGIDLKTNEDAYAENASNITTFQEEIAESVEDRIAREAAELAMQQDAYRQFYLEFETKTADHHSRLNALSAEGYAQQDLSMKDWLEGMTKRQAQEYEIQENLARLKGRNIPEAMLEELKAAGPGYSKLISELANANDTDLQKVVNTWEGNGELAKQMALDELGEMPEEARKLLKRYQTATDEELEELVDSYAEQHQISREQAIKELSALPSESAAIIKESVEYVKGAGTTDMRKAYESMGSEAAEGLTSSQKAVLRAAGAMVDEAIGEAGIRTKGMSEVGDKAGQTYADGMKGASSAVGQAGKALAEQALTSASEVSLYGAGADAGQTLADGVASKSLTANEAFKKLLNNMLTSMETFMGKIATALNGMLSDFGTTMGSLSVSTSGKVSYTPIKNKTIARLADGGEIHRAARGIQLLKKPTMLTSNVQAGEAGTEIVFPLENSKFIRAFADDIARSVSDANMYSLSQNINQQMEQARAGAMQAAMFNAPSATEISEAIRSWFTPQMQSLHDVLEQDRVVDITVPNTSNALWRMVLAELKAVNPSSGARGFLPS